MQSQVRYVTSSDGTRLAVWTLGEGKPLIIVPNVLTRSLDAYLEVPESRENLVRLAEGRKLVVYDFRGVGLSSHNVEDFSLPALENDLAAVVDAFEFPKINLLAIPLSGPPAISYAAHNPDRVEKLVLWGASARGRDVPRSKELGDIRGLVDSNWPLYIQNLALITYGWTDDGRRWAEGLAAGLTRETYMEAMRQFRLTDVTDLLPQMRCQTLILHRRGQDIAVDREMAATIPNARMMTLSQGTTWGFLAGGRWESTLAPIATFLDESGDTEEPQLPSGTAVILFADIVDSTALTEQLGDAAFREKARELGPALREVIRNAGGTPVEGPTLGDGILAAFSSAREAIEAALACARAGEALGLPLHLGLHAGDVTREKDPDGRDNVYGGAVNIASRISGLSAPGEVLVSDTVRSLARTSAGVRFEDRGDQPLKGVGEPVRVWAVLEE